MVVLAQYLHPELILFTDEIDRDKVIQELTELAAQAEVIPDKAAFYNAVIEREKIVSTGIGMGVAIPHAKLDECDQFFIALGVHRKQGIEWNSLDGSLVQLVFLVGGPASEQKNYLNILSRLTSMIKYGGLREGLLKAKQPSHVLDLFKRYDQ
jgi:nitrogen PTS system EIIA component